MMDLMINVSQFRKPSKEDYYTILQADNFYTRKTEEKKSRNCICLLVE